MTVQLAGTPSSPLTETVVAALQALGLEADWLDEGALVQVRDHRLVLEVAQTPQRPVVVRAHMPLDIFVEEDGLPDSLMGLNLLNQGLDYGMLLLDPLEDEETEDADLEDLAVTFAVVGRTVIPLQSTQPAEMQRLYDHLHLFEAEVFDSLESAINSAGAMSA